MAVGDLDEAFLLYLIFISNLCIFLRIGWWPIGLLSIHLLWMLLWTIHGFRSSRLTLVTGLLISLLLVRLVLYKIGQIKSESILTSRNFVTYLRHHLHVHQIYLWLFNELRCALLPLIGVSIYWDHISLVHGGGLLRLLLLLRLLNLLRTSDFNSDGPFLRRSSFLSRRFGHLPLLLWLLDCQGVRPGAAFGEDRRGLLWRRLSLSAGCATFTDRVVRRGLLRFIQSWQIAVIVQHAHSLL